VVLDPQGVVLGIPLLLEKVIVVVVGPVLAVVHVVVVAAVKMVGETVRLLRIGHEKSGRPRRGLPGLHVVAERIDQGPRLRRAVTTLLFILISVMIVRDILVRRWSSPAPPASDVTERSR